MSARVARALLGVCVLLAAACDADTKCDAENAALPLFGASTDPLALERREQNAVVALTESSENMQAGLCTGVLIAPSRVLTARHCAEQLPAHVRAFVGPSVEGHDFASPVAAFAVHDDYDIALATLADPVPADLARPLQLVDEGRAIEVGTRATLVGYGLTEDDGLGVRLYLEEPIVEVDRSEVTVDGDGETGACVGDSGGPLLVRDEAGRHQVVGVLSAGSASCLNIDVYQRIEPVREWLAPPPPAGPGCGH